MDFAQVKDFIRSSALSQHADYLISRLMLSARVVVDDKAAANPSDGTKSHFGGLPSLTSDSMWPYWDRSVYLQAQINRLEGEFQKNPRAIGLRDIAVQMREELIHPIVPLAFLAQLDLSELQSAAALLDWPSEGTLAFFHAWPQHAWSFDPTVRGHCRVIYCPSTERTEVAKLPADFPNEAKFPRRAVSFLPEWTLPFSIDEDGVKLSFWGDDDYQELYRIIMSMPDDASLVHRSGGHPQEVQGNMQRECQLVTNGIYCGDSSSAQDPRVPQLLQGTADWQLLLQLDSDVEQLGWMWYDVGRLYFWARQQDITQGNFDKSWAILQCY